MQAGNSGLLGPIAYELRTLVERANFSGIGVVHDLPQIHHYWSNKFLKPKCEQLGFSGTDDFYLTFIKDALCRGEASEQSKIISVGSATGTSKFGWRVGCWKTDFAIFISNAWT